MILLRTICWLKTIWRSLPSIIQGNYPIDGCDYVDIEEHENCKVTISKCEVCGKIDISWTK